MGCGSYNFRELSDNMCFEGDFVRAEPYGSGHINDTFAVYFENGPFRRYLLQRINHNIFKKPDELMKNIESVTLFLKEKIIERGGDYLRETLNLIPAKGGGSFYRDSDGNYWRCYHFVEDTLSFDIAESPELMYCAGKAFGQFQSLLSDFPVDSLYESIPDFHNTPKRYRDFTSAVEADVCGRAESAQSEIDFVTSRCREAALLQTMIDNKEIPLRVTHNDTKLNNVLFDASSKKGICVVDLDTIMPGSMLYDFGDSIRFGANSAAEDEINLDNVHFMLDYYEAFKKGFLEELGGSITEAERLNLPLGAKTMTLECGMRFLTDYLSGDTYFKTTRPSHNLDRARTQFKLLLEMERLI